MAVSFTVDHQAVPQPRPKVRVINGHGMAYTEKTHPIHAYRAAIAASFRQKYPRSVPMSCPVFMRISVTMARPPSHILKSGRLAKGAPALPPPDTDNLAKGIKDALNGLAYLDDRLVAAEAVSKVYGPAPSTVITILPVEPPPHDTEDHPPHSG